VPLVYSLLETWGISYNLKVFYQKNHHLAGGKQILSNKHLTNNESPVSLCFKTQIEQTRSFHEVVPHKEKSKVYINIKYVSRVMYDIM